MRKSCEVVGSGRDAHAGRTGQQTLWSEATVRTFRFGDEPLEDPLENLEEESPNRTEQAPARSDGLSEPPRTLLGIGVLPVPVVATEEELGDPGPAKTTR